MFYGMFSGNQYEQALVYNRLFGPYRWGYYALIFCNGLVPQFLWIPYFRTKNLVALWIICQIVSIGMWLERYVIIPVSLTRDFLPSSWGYYTPSRWDTLMFLGTIGLFTFLMFLFIRFLPMINIFEMKDLLHRQRGHAHHDDHAASGSTQAQVVPVD
jgi:molybdopterin-containing oxidoreductase family membrane subunit